jgi:phenylacetate-CoA ligase
MSGLTERVYTHSPIPVQQAFVAAYGLWWYRRRFNRHFDPLVRQFKERECWTEDQFAEYQDKRLREVLAIAHRSEYYRGLFTEAGVGDKTSPQEALRRLPVLTTETLRSRGHELLTSSPPPKGTLTLKSSGTTGTPKKLYYTEEYHAFQLAVREARNYNWAGVTHRDRRVMFGLRKVCSFDQQKPPFWRFSPVENLAYASIFHLSPRFMPDYLKFLREYKPAIIMGFPSAINTLAQFALENNDLPAPAKAVFTTSEAVSAHARQAIEAAWQCRIQDHYGAVEGCMFASQCEHGHYHVSPEVGIIEIVDEDGWPCPPGVLGEVVCTSLENTLQPLIRYRIGDVARWSVEQSCPCGRNMPILEAIEGRFEDLCFTTDGRRVSWFDPVFEGVKNFSESQVVQEALGSFTVYIVPNNGFGEGEVERIKANMRWHVGEAETRVETVDAIPRSKSGKFQAVICKLSPEERVALDAANRKVLQGTR